MKIKIEKLDKKECNTDVLVLFFSHKSIYELKRKNTGLAPTIVSELISFISYNDFKADEYEIRTFYLPNNKTRRILLAGIGTSAISDIEKLRKICYAIYQELKRIKGKIAHFILDNIEIKTDQSINVIAETLLLSNYSFKMYKKEKEKDMLTLEQVIFLVPAKDYHPSIKSDIDKTMSTVEGVSICRTLANKPGNILTPRLFAQEIKELFKNSPEIRVEILNEKKIQSLKMEAFLSVSKGSKEPPRLILLEYKSGIKNAKKLALIGKGITFDSGGISIKPSAKMEEMKYDMAGGGAVAGAMYVAGKIKPKLDIIAAIPAAENLPGGDATRPGDVITAYNGKTIEIIDTDAEGRLLLADVLAFVVKTHNPDWIIDLATLTGSVVVALGNRCSGLFGNNQKLMDMVKEAGERSGDPVWQMPMFDDYKEQLESTIADLKNVGGREAGSITAAKFLEEFVDQTPWSHLDIAGTAYNVKDTKYANTGATGTGVRLISRLFEILVKNKKI